MVLPKSAKARIRHFFLGNTDELLKDDRFIIDKLFFNRRLKFRTMRSYQLGKMKVGDIRYGTGAQSVSLREVSPFKYLQGDIGGYSNYCRQHRQLLHYDEMTVAKYDNLIKSIENKGFDDRFVIIVDYDGVVKDGQHRSCYLLHKFGEQYEVPVLKLDVCKRSIFYKALRYIYKKCHGFN